MFIMQSKEVTEEIALEHFMNGDLAQALDTYEQLIRQYPERKDYWLDQMNILSSEITDEEINAYRNHQKKIRKD